MQQSELVCIKKVPGKGRGVFARKAIKKGELIEHTPLLIVPVEALVDGLENEFLGQYYYWRSERHIAIALGYGSLYNHSWKPKATFRLGKASIKYFALRDIKAGEEITINYNLDPKDRTPVGFKILK